MENRYAIKRHSDPSRPKMSREKRAKQFAPFAALNGFEDEIEDATINFDDYDKLIREEIVEEP